MIICVCWFCCKGLETVGVGSNLVLPSFVVCIGVGKTLVTIVGVSKRLGSVFVGVEESMLLEQSEHWNKEDLLLERFPSDNDLCVSTTVRNALATVIAKKEGNECWM